MTEQKKTLVMVTHDDHFATYADRMFHIRDGKILKIEDNRKNGSGNGESGGNAGSGYDVSYQNLEQPVRSMPCWKERKYQMVRQRLSGDSCRNCGADHCGSGSSFFIRKWNSREDLPVSL